MLIFHEVLPFAAWLGYNGAVSKKEWGNDFMAYEEVCTYAASKKEQCITNDTISDILFKEYGVNRGLRDVNGKGVLTGLTNISKITSFSEENGKSIPCDGELWYRGYNVKTLINGIAQDEFGFEKIAYLLLFGELPSKEEARKFAEILGSCRRLPTNFTRDVIMKAPSKDIMNSMTRSILTLASYDDATSVGTIENCIRQSIQLIAEFPMLAVYAYHAYNHYENDSSMYIHRPDPDLSTAENFLRMLRPDNQYTMLEAKVLDVALILHMEHGGGNNSTFTTRVVTSAGTDTYSAIAAAMSSLKGPKHGGANIKVMEMMDNIRANVKDWDDRDEVRAYLARMLDGEVFDKKGLIYGMGHAVYSISDPRERVFRSYVERLAVHKEREKDLRLYNAIEELAPELIAEKRKIFKGVSPNVDFYSGFVYEMLGIPMELYTPLFAIARIVGWSAHRLEEMVGMNKIIRPAYMSVMEELE
jgi:citrate synthase